MVGCVFGAAAAFAAAAAAAAAAEGVVGAEGGAGCVCALGSGASGRCAAITLAAVASRGATMFAVPKVSGSDFSRYAVALEQLPAQCFRPFVESG